MELQLSLKITEGVIMPVWRATDRDGGQIVVNSIELGELADKHLDERDPYPEVLKDLEALTDKNLSLPEFSNRKLMIESASNFEGSLILLAKEITQNIVMFRTRKN